MGRPVDSGWRREGGHHCIDWAGETWDLGARGGRFGLFRRGREEMILALGDLADSERFGEGVVTDSALVDVDVSHGRLLATFEPEGWHGLTLRAAWGPSREGRGMDLEVQAATSSVGELRKLVVLVGSDPGRGEAPPDGDPLFEWTRESRTPVTTWDRAQSGDAAAYLEMARREDVRRWRITSEPGLHASRYELFGHDLEKGVVLRGRLRGLRLDRPGGEVERHELDCFLREPLPLRTS